MEENYLLSVTGTQHVNGDSDKIELQTNASYVTKNESRYITYKEYDANNPDKHYRTTIKVSPEGIVTVMKGGMENHNLILEKGVRHKCEYSTPFGTVTLGVYTQKIRNDLHDSGGELEVAYTIDMESQLASTNELYIKLKKIQEEP